MQTNELAPALSKSGPTLNAATISMSSLFLVGASEQCRAGSNRSFDQVPPRQGEAAEGECYSGLAHRGGDDKGEVVPAGPLGIRQHAHAVAYSINLAMLFMSTHTLCHTLYKGQRSPVQSSTARPAAWSSASAGQSVWFL